MLYIHKIHAIHTYTKFIPYIHICTAQAYMSHIHRMCARAGLSDYMHAYVHTISQHTHSIFQFPFSIISRFLLELKLLDVL